GAIDLRRALAAVEQGHGQFRSHRPEAVWQADPVGEGTAAVTAAQAESQVWKVGCFSYADVGIGSNHRTLGRSDVRTPLKQLRRQAQGNLRQRGDVLSLCQVELCRRHPRQYGDGVFQLGALPDQVDEVRLSAL